jgi:hypothetical protein
MNIADAIATIAAASHLDDETKTEAIGIVREGVEKVQALLAGVAAATSDESSAHSREDLLYTSVLAAIAAGADDPAGLARTALESQRLEFSRY